MSGQAQMRDGEVIKVLIAWVIVGIPLLWGVVETGANAMKLFQ